MLDFRKQTSDETVWAWLNRRVCEVHSGQGTTVNIVVTSSSLEFLQVQFMEGDSALGTTTFVDGVLNVSLGKDVNKLYPEDVMATFAGAVQFVQGMRLRAARFILPNSVDVKFAAMGIQSALLRGDEFKTEPFTYLGLKKVEIVCPHAAHATVEGAFALARASNVSRWLGSMPANVVGVEEFICLLRWVFKDSEVELLGDGGEPNTAEYSRMELLNAVASGNGGRRYVFAFRMDPLDGPTDKVVAYVGKTLVFDTGGNNIKPNGGRGMKGDKGGGCVLLGAAMHLVHNRHLLNRSVVFVWTITENMVGPEAYRPDDVYTGFSGQTVEVDNTDAEGRLALADAMAWVCEQASVEQLVPVCTLTGAAVVALGASSTALHLKNSRRRIEEIRDLEALSFASGDAVNVLHHHPESAVALKSDIADMKNSGGGNRKAGSQQGFAFLLKHAPKDVDVMELDIAGKFGDFEGGGGMEKGTANPAGTWFIIANELVRKATLK